MSLEIYFHGSDRHAISVIFEELEDTQEQKKHLAQHIKQLIEHQGTLLCSTIPYRDNPVDFVVLSLEGFAEAKIQKPSNALHGYIALYEDNFPETLS